MICPIPEILTPSAGAGLEPHHRLHRPLRRSPGCDVLRHRRGAAALAKPCQLSAQHNAAEHRHLRRSRPQERRPLVQKTPSPLALLGLPGPLPPLPHHLHVEPELPLNRLLHQATLPQSGNPSSPQSLVQLALLAAAADTEAAAGVVSGMLPAAPGGTQIVRLYRLSEI
jgi:hypothetical protein